MNTTLQYILVILSVLFIIPVAFAQQHQYFDVNDGLSSSYITSILQDKEDYIWIATEDGLNRFDGHKLVIYRNIPDDTTSLINNHVVSIYEDSKNRFWIATLTGLCLYDRMTDRFSPFVVPHYNNEKEVTQFYFLMEDSKGYIWACISGDGVVRIDVEKQEFVYFNTMNSGICSNHINVIYEDRFGNIWFGSGQDGISIYNPGNGTFRTFRYHPENKNGISSNDISYICEDMEGNVWVGTLTGGINIYSFAKQSFQVFDYHSRKISFLKRDSKKDIWIGTMGSGYDIYSTKEKKLKKKKIESSQLDLLHTKVQTIYEDKQGNIWIGFFQKGLFMIPEQKSLFTNYHFNPYSKLKTIEEGAVAPILINSSNELWLGVDGKGVYRLDKDMHILKHYGPGDESRLFDNVALCMFEDSKRNIWIGTFLNGAIRYNPSINKFDLSLIRGEAPYNLLSSHIKDIKEDTDGKIWFATNGSGINIYNPHNNTFEYIIRDESQDEENQLVYNYCSFICFDKENICWIGTFRGLCSYDKENQQFTHYTSKNKTLPNDIITFLKEDSNGNMWVGTQNGLACLDKSREKINIYSINDGLPNSVINGIEEDNEGNIWIVTNNGLSMFNPENKKFHNYTTSDGLFTNEFTRNAILKTKNSELIIGSMKGITSFNPSQNKKFPDEPLNLLFTNLYIFNEKIEISHSPENILQNAINYSDEITLAHDKNSFSLEIAAIEYISPGKVKYEAIMKGFDKQWQSVKNNMITYTNLEAGNYNLKVRAWINNKDEALVRELKIRILPPIWGTIGAKIFYCIVLLSLGYLGYRYINDRLTAKRQEQIIQDKLQFFTDISHEIRTPLTLILTPLNKLISKTTDISLMSTYNGMHKNGIRLLQLVNQVMDLRAIEFGKKKLYVEKINITVFIRDLKNSFNHLSEEKNLAYTFTSRPERITGYIDIDILSKVLFNLISNAFKFTEEGSIKIIVSVNKKGRLVISVSDTGKGIPENKQKLIFERFYTTSAGERSNSSGIGLHLASKLIRLHHGEIILESKEGEGSCFFINIPYLEEDFKEEERNTSSVKSLTKEVKYLYTNNSIIKKPISKNGKSHHSILIVEDNKEIKELLLSELYVTYHLLEASNGKEGLHLAIEKQPTLIISDIIMPEMDGIEFCKKIRNNENTNHIPFIMLTARSSVEQQIEGVEHGADAYIIKPFDIAYLKVIIERLIDSRKKLKEKYEHPSVGIENVIPASESYDDKFLKNLNSLIDEKLIDSDLNIDVLCKSLGLSRTHLNRKMKELTGESPATYIRQIRLRKSARLLKERKLTISEITFTVGFSSPSYFSQAFRDYYGVTPKEYMNIEEDPVS